MRAAGVVQGRAVLIGGIPPALTCADLRAFFAPEVEGEAFVCFHDRVAHPELGLRTVRCLVEEAHLDAVSRYHGVPWVDGLDAVCSITVCADAPAMRAADPVEPRGRRFLTRAERRAEASKPQLARPPDSSHPELPPPGWLPRGNVGTPTRDFRRCLAACRVAPRALRLLGLDTVVRPAAWPECPTAHVAEPFDYCEVRHGEKVAGWMTRSGPAGRVAGGTLRADETVASRRRTESAAHAVSCAARGLPTGGGRTRRRGVVERWGGPARQANDKDDRISGDRPTCADWRSQRVDRDDEEVGDVWQEGGPDLAFCTDDASWQKDAGVRQERVVTGWDGQEGEDQDDWDPARATASAGDAHPTRVPGMETSANAHRAVPQRLDSAAPLLGTGVAASIMRSLGWDPSRPGLGKRRQGSVEPLAVELARTAKRRRGHRGLRTLGESSAT